MNLPASPNLALDSPQLQFVKAARVVLGRDPRIAGA